MRTQLRIRDVNDQLRRANLRLKELVDTDDLTGLFNMRSLYQRLDFELEACPPIRPTNLRCDDGYGSFQDCE